MHDSLVVRGRQTVCDVHSVVNRFALRQGTTVKCLAQVFPLQQFRNQKWRAVVLADVKHRQNIGMIQRRHGARLLLETVKAIRILRKGFWKNLQRDIPPEPSVVRAVHLPHATSAQRRLNFIGAEFRPNSEGHGCA